MGECGVFQCVARGEQLPPHARVIGFEVVNVDVGAIGHSWLCNGLENHCADVLGIRPAANGLLASLDDAIRCRDEIDREEVGAEPGPWYPLLLWEP